MNSTTTLFAILAGIATVAYAADAPLPKVVGLPFTRTKKNVSQLPPLARRETVEMDLTNESRGYFINVTVGTPPQTVQLHLDTGSSDTWFPYRLSDECKRTGCNYGVFEPKFSSTFEDLSAIGKFKTTYKDGTEVAGKYFSDTLNMSGHNITHMMMGLATNITRTLPYSPDTESGIMGIGYQADEALAYVGSSKTYPNVPRQLLEQGHISSLAYSLWLNDDDAELGTILFGGVDTAKYHGDLIAVPIVPRLGIYIHFTVSFSGMAITNKAGKNIYNRQELAVPIVLDSGSTFTMLPRDLAMEILRGVGAREQDHDWLVPCSLCSSGASINFSFGGAGGPAIAVPFEDVCFPYPQDKSMKGEQECVFGIYPMSDGIEGISGVGGIFGDTFLRSAYVVYNLHQNVIALAQTNLNATDSNIKEITNSSIPGVVSTAKGVDVSLYSPPTSKVELIPGPATFDFDTAARGQALGAAALAAGQLPPRLSLQLIMSGVAVIFAGLFGGSLAVLW